MLYHTKGVIFSPVCRKRWKFLIHITISGSYLNVKKKTTWRNISILFARCHSAAEIAVGVRECWGVFALEDMVIALSWYWLSLSERKASFHSDLVYSAVFPRQVTDSSEWSEQIYWLGFYNFQPIFILGASCGILSTVIIIWELN